MAAPAAAATRLLPASCPGAAARPGNGAVKGAAVAELPGRRRAQVLRVRAGRSSADASSLRSGGKARAGAYGYSRAGRRCRTAVAAAADGEQLSEQVEKDAEEMKKQAEDIKGIAEGTAQDMNGGPERAQDVLKSAAEQLRGHAESIKTHADSARENFLDQASSATDHLKQRASKTADQLQKDGDKTAAQLNEEARKASEELKAQADRAATQLAMQAHETAEVAKGKLAAMTEDAPGFIKDIADTAINAHSKEAASRGAKIHDFCFGIPYGGLLTAGGLVWFLLAGSIDALRFGAGLGGILLAASVMSFRAWKQSKPCTTYIGVQAAISFILLCKEVARFSQTGALFPTLLTAVVSAIMVAFYAYVLSAGGNPPKKEQRSVIVSGAL